MTAYGAGVMHDVLRNLTTDCMTGDSAGIMNSVLKDFTKVCIAGDDARVMHGDLRYLTYDGMRAMVPMSCTVFAGSY
jgi:hypothetical protein